MGGLADEECSATGPALDGLLDASAVVAAPAKHRPDGRLRQRDEHRNGHLSRPGVSGESRCREERSDGTRPSNYSPKLRARSVRMVTELAPDYPPQYAGIADPPVLGVHRARLPGRHRQPRRRRAARHSWSDPRDESGYSAEDLLSLGFSTSPPDAALVQKSIALADADLDSLRCVLPRRRPGQDHRCGLPCHVHGTTPNRPQGIVVTDFRRHLPPAGGNRGARRYAHGGA